jgi:hypothetical protein
MKRAVDYDDDKIDGQMHPNKGSTKSSRSRAGTQFGNEVDDDDDDSGPNHDAYGSGQSRRKLKVPGRSGHGADDGGSNNMRIMKAPGISKVLNVAIEHISCPSCSARLVLMQLEHQNLGIAGSKLQQLSESNLVLSTKTLGQAQ